MRVLHVVNSVNPVDGGVIEAVRQWATVLTGLGHTVEIACLDSPESPWLKDIGVTVYPLGPRISSYGYSKHMVPWLRENRGRYDYVVVDGLWQFNSFAAWRALSRTSTPYFVFTHGMLDPWFKRKYPLKHLKKCLYWLW